MRENFVFVQETDARRNTLSVKEDERTSLGDQKIDIPQFQSHMKMFTKDTSIVEFELAANE